MKVFDLRQDLLGALGSLAMAHHEMRVSMQSPVPTDQGKAYDELIKAIFHLCETLTHLGMATMETEEIGPCVAPSANVN